MTSKKPILVFILISLLGVLWLKSLHIEEKKPEPITKYIYPYKPVEQHLVNKWKLQTIKAKEIILEAAKHSNPASFPTLYDTLAIIAIESGFNQFAVSSSNAKGLMQILYKPTSFHPGVNIRDGVSLLKEYKRSLKSKEAAIQAYNVGIGNYLEGMRNHNYLNKFNKERNELRKFE